YADWDDLMDYCAFSAMPVGRFVLDVHGEARSTWPASDALCAALQVINHLQDCGKDYRDLDRVYIPVDAFAAAGTGPEALAAPRASKELLACIRDLAARTALLLDEAAPFALQITDRRLALEVSVIHRLAARLTAGLAQRDPLSERVHLSGLESAPLALLAMGQTLVSRLIHRPAVKPQSGHRP
ncbi:MAG TPA: squalene/phytoene synthase family protein, partial [Verrucomicrobiae bacterium]|nr:squalene/phytoene synthase family protein [Verrucomicrobiae bacterium]